VGNIYINRNQIGAVVESQPFGGEGLSGTGPKAGGPQYIQASEPAGLDKALPIHQLKGNLNPAQLAHLSGLAGVSLSGAEDWCRQARRILSQRQGVIVPLLIEPGVSPRHVCEKHLCEDTTAAGGNP